MEKLLFITIGKEVRVKEWEILKDTPKTVKVDKTPTEPKACTQVIRKSHIGIPKSITNWDFPISIICYPDKKAQAIRDMMNIIEKAKQALLNKLSRIDEGGIAGIEYLNGMGEFYVVPGSLFIFNKESVKDLHTDFNYNETDRTTRHSPED